MREGFRQSTKFLSRAMGAFIIGWEIGGPMFHTHPISIPALILGVVLTVYGFID